ncbi:MAG: phosphotransferase family protein [unclassified Hahellaceae]|nr:phosphotransferase family protein [Hahellaceae bacterium]|tara:strand:- start:17480 stop:18586 length:1107 start_codon:yes stop_codon:yes gene_type:complete
MSLKDQSIEIREGEQFDNAAVERYLRAHIGDLPPHMSVRQFPGGASNLTYLLSFTDSANDAPGRQSRQFVLRRPPTGKKAKSAHDMKREYTVMSALNGHYRLVPKMHVFCEDESLIGGEFYVMEKLDGIILRNELPTELVTGEQKLSPDNLRQLCMNMIDGLVDLHKFQWQDTALADLKKDGDYVERQISGWNDRFVKARTPDVPECDKVMQWLDDHKPKQVDSCLIHNDYRFDNIVLDEQNPMQINGVLDWEMATIGDPLMDLGNSLAYWVQADDPQQFHMMRRQPSHAPGMMTRDELVEYYLKQSGRSVDNFTFYRVYGLFRLAVIIQQIYYRFYHGQTKDKRFAGFGFVVKFIDDYLQKQISELG